MAAPAPVNVVAMPGPNTPESPILVDANDSVVARLPWLNWAPAPAVGGIPRVSLSNSEALAAFAIRCKLDRSPAAVAAFQAVNPYTLRLTPAAWSILLTAVRDNGLAAATVNVLEQLHEYIRLRVPIVVIGAVHWSPAPPFVNGANAAARAVSGYPRLCSSCVGAI